MLNTKFDLSTMYQECLAAREEADRERYEAEKERLEAYKKAQAEKNAKFTATLNLVADKRQAEAQQRLEEEIAEARNNAEAEVRKRHAKSFGENDPAKLKALRDVADQLNPNWM